MAKVKMNKEEMMAFASMLSRCLDGNFENLLENGDISPNWDGKSKVKFHYACSKNLKNLRNSIEAWEEESKPLQEFLDKKKEVLEELCRRDDDDNPIFTDDQSQAYDIPEENMEELNTKIKEIADETKQTERDEEVMKIIKEQENYDIHQISYDEFPTGFSGRVIQMFLPMIKD